MKALIQRVTSASVTVDRELVSKIGPGLVALIGVAIGDSDQDVRYLAEKVVRLRIFSDPEGKFNLSLMDTGGSLLAVSQFTLLADTKKGRRPSFVNAAPPDQAEQLFNIFVEECRRLGARVETGRFQTHMLVEINNDGPVTILIDSREKFDPQSS